MDIRPKLIVFLVRDEINKFWSTKAKAIVSQSLFYTKNIFSNHLFFTKNSIPLRI